MATRVYCLWPLLSIEGVHPSRVLFVATTMNRKYTPSVYYPFIYKIIIIKIIIKIIIIIIILIIEHNVIIYIIYNIYNRSK